MENKTELGKALDIWRSLLDGKAMRLMVDCMTLDELKEANKGPVRTDPFYVGTWDYEKRRK